jgi:CRISPR-associated protein Cas1
VPEELRPDGRNRRPPKDRFNAALSYGYALIYQNVLQAILAVGLEPALGFFHTPRSAAQPLVLDLMELFRVTLWDIPLVGSLNRLQWDLQKDFQVTSGRVWLSPSGRKKTIELFEKRLKDTWRHPAIGYSLSYARLIELEVRLLEKEWTGQPGLFARMRLR